VLISIIGFVESVSVAQTLAARKRQRIVPDQELIGLGAANVGAAFTGGYPVTGGFARSVVNFDAGAETPAAGAYTAVGICCSPRHAADAADLQSCRRRRWPPPSSSPCCRWWISRS
jgi:MFS superfamily sulfate permease-like transporter